MDAIDEINVGVPRRAKKDIVARSAAGSSMSGGIVGAEVGFYFHDSPGEKFPHLFAHDQLPQEIPRDLPRITIEELARERKRLEDLSFRYESHPASFPR